MDDLHVLRVLTALANGTDPNTGEIYPPESPYQSPDVIRALFAATRALENRKSQIATPGQSSRQGENAVRHAAGANVGKNWSANEDQQLLTGFDAGKSLSELAQIHGRTQGGVRARLEKHGRLEPSPATRWPAGRSNASAHQNGQGGQGTSRPNQ
jgi:hypothetical protein